MKPKHIHDPFIVNKSRRSFLRNTTLALPIIILPGFNPPVKVPEQYVHRNTFAMGTMVTIQAYGTNIPLLNAAIYKAFHELRRLDSLLSIYQSKSDVCRINAASGKSEVEVSRETIEVLRSAHHFSISTGGIFDCTVEPLLRLWGFRHLDSPRYALPTDREIQHVLEVIGYQQISIDERNQKIGLLKAGGAIDLGGIAVGYTVDRMAAILRSEGIERALINHSGDIYAIGSPPDSMGWQIGIPSLTSTEEIVHTIQLSDAAISTSSSTEKYIEIGGIHYGHILDPYHGTASVSSKSVSVITQLSMLADVYSTVLYSNDRALKNVENNGTELEVIIVDSESKYGYESYTI